jgi:hypothetical protein
MRVHRVPSGVDIAICDTLQDLAMVSERSGGGTRCPPAETAKLNEHVTDGAQEDEEQFIVRSPSQGSMKVDVGANERFLILETRLGLTEDSHQRSDILRRRVTSSETGDLDLQHATNFHHFVEVDPAGGNTEVEEQAHRLGRGVERQSADNRTATRSDIEQAPGGERTHGLANDGATDRELFGEMALGRQALARPQVTVNNQALQMGGDAGNE